MRRMIVAVGALLFVGTVTGCGPKSDTAAPPPPVTAPPATTAAAPVPTPSSSGTATASTTATAGCPQLRDLTVGTPAVPLADYQPATVRLTGGQATLDGTLFTLMDPCAVGDLDGDGRADAIGTVQFTSGGSGHWFDLVVWLGSAAGPLELAGSTPLGDRNPVEQITVTGPHTVTVVYLTRTDDQPMAALNVRRTTVFGYSAGGLTEVSHTDRSYSELTDPGA